MTRSLIGDVIQMGVYGENQVGLGLSRPLDGLACPIKFFTGADCPNLGLFWGSSTMYC